MVADRGAEAAPGRRLRVRGPPCVTGCGRVGLICVRRLRRVTALPAGAVAHLRRDITDGRRTSMPDPAGPVARVAPGRELGAGRYPMPCDYEVSSCGWLRHRPGGVGVRSEYLSEHHGAMGPSMSWDPWPRPVRDRPWGQRSVHRLAKTAPRHRSEAFVYTVVTRGSRELRREPRRVA